MKQFLKLAVGLVVVAAIAAAGPGPSCDEWPGVDEAVVKKFAEQAGRPPREPYINTARGDMLLFVFLLAGALGGFTAGYYFRELFPPQTTRARDSSHV